MNTTTDEEFLAELARRVPASPCNSVSTKNGPVSLSPSEYRRLGEIMQREKKSAKDLIEARL